MNNTQGALKKLHSMLHNMHEMSIRDKLTGLYNRRFFSEQADLLLIRATRYEEPLSVVYVDIVHFKDVNDTLRLSAAWEFSLGRWFGRHRVAGLVENARQDRVRRWQNEIGRASCRERVCQYV